MMQLQEVAALMKGFDRPWWVAGGWALELFVGRPLRAHGDLEIGLWRDDQMLLRQHLNEWEWQTAITVDGAGQWVPWRAGERVELPSFQLKANRTMDAANELEFMLNDQSEGHFQFRREPSIRLPADCIVARSREGFPYLLPEIQLLYKAKHHRPKDEVDFAAVTEVMSGPQRRWLKAALQRWNADDPWIALL